MKHRHIMLMVYGDESMYKNLIEIRNSNGFSLTELQLLNELLTEEDFSMYKGKMLDIEVIKRVENKELFYDFEIVDKIDMNSLKKIIVDK